MLNKYEYDPDNYPWRQGTCFPFLWVTILTEKRHICTSVSQSTKGNSSCSPLSAQDRERNAEINFIIISVSEGGSCPGVRRLNGSIRTRCAWAGKLKVRWWNPGEPFLTPFNCSCFRGPPQEVGSDDLSYSLVTLSDWPDIINSKSGSLA